MPTFHVALREFLLACRANGLSEASVHWYDSILRPASETLGDILVEQITTGDLRNYVVNLRLRTTRYPDGQQQPTKSGGLSTESLRGHHRALRRFFAWCQGEYQMHNPMLGIRQPAPARRAPKALALEDLRRLLEACDDTVSGRRDKALLAFLADTGCRAGGALSLTPASLFLSQGRALVREKGDRARTVPFTRYTAALLQSWIDVRPPEAATIFCSLGRYYLGDPLTISGLNQLIQRLAQRAGVTGRCNPHSFRHCFARQYLENGGDLARLAQLMGHSDVSVTAKSYAVFTDGELSRHHEQFSPLKGLTEEEEEH